MSEKPSRLRSPDEWTRDVGDRKLAGVCASVAHNLGAPVVIVRAAFLVLAVWHGIGLLLYAILWMLMPPAAGERAPLDSVFDGVRGLLAPHERRRLDDDEYDPDDRYV